MSLMDHVLNIAGIGGGLLPSDIKAGLTVVKVEWDGCMATIRKEVDIGEVIDGLVTPSPHDDGRYPGKFVLWDKRGRRWEPLAHFRRVDGALEVWE